MARVEDIGSGLGRSLDRVEQNLTRHIEHLQNANELQDKVLFEHLASHAELDVAKLSNESVHIKRRRSK